MEDTQNRFGVDLNKEEYLQFQTLLTQSSAIFRFKGLRWLLTVLTLVMCGTVTVMEWKTSGELDPVLIGCAVLLVVFEVYLSVMVPRRAAKQAELAYERTVGSGYSFAGYIEIQPNALLKKTASLENTVLFEECSLFIEHHSMMVFCSSREKAIAIPARFLTAEDADRLRDCAMKHIPVARQRLLSRLVPGTAQRIPAETPEELPEEVIVLSLPILYTAKEFQGFMLDCFFDTIGKQLISAALIGALLAVVAQGLFSAMGLPVFLLGTALILCLNLVMTVVRSRKIISDTQENILHIWVRFSDQSLSLQGSGENSRKTTLPWSSITRVVEQPDKYQFYSGALFLTIPKRCVENPDAFKELVDSHLQKG